VLVQRLKKWVCACQVLKILLPDNSKVSEIFIRQLKVTQGLRKNSKRRNEEDTTIQWVTNPPVIRYNDLYPCPRYPSQVQAHNALLSISRGENTVMGTSKTGTGDNLSIIE
jgi:hypothetical protein